MKQVIIFLAVCLVMMGGMTTPVRAILNPYQDYIIVMVHGINDYRRSFTGDNEEWENEKRARLDLEKHLQDALDIPDGHIHAYSYSNSRGTNLVNALELGYPGIKPLIVGNDGNVKEKIINYANLNSWGSETAKAAEVGSIGAGMWLGAMGGFEAGKIGGASGFASGAFGGALASIPIARQVVGEALPYLGVGDFGEKVRKTNILQSYFPALDKHFSTEVEYGKSFLEQAVADWKNWFLTSAENKDSLGNKIYNDSDKPIPTALIPSKFILITHSMGNPTAQV